MGSCYSNKKKPTCEICNQEIKPEDKTVKIEVIEPTGTIFRWLQKHGKNSHSHSEDLPDKQIIIN